MASSISINFFTEDIQFKLSNKGKIRSWIKETIQTEGFKLQELNFIFCSDNYLLQINRNYLKHDTFTDIITFDTGESENFIKGDIFISVERVAENAAKFHTMENDELHRVVIHGILHLLGYPDKGKKASSLMRTKENFYLSLRKF